MTVIAKDEGTSPKSSEVKVYMNVKDANDNEPVFDPMTYYTELAEDAPVGTPLVDVNATDIDSGEYIGGHVVTSHRVNELVFLHMR